jgi:hypothetical protein
MRLEHDYGIHYPGNPIVNRTRNAIMQTVVAPHMTVTAKIGRCRKIQVQNLNTPTTHVFIRVSKSVSKSYLRKLLYNQFSDFDICCSKSAPMELWVGHGHILRLRQRRLLQSIFARYVTRRCAPPKNPNLWISVYQELQGLG